ncbi:sugar transporter, putative [Plasmodium gallinaceum]|uniref:Sugar transporter, putative n=1 Tax=Plasmodium gallinaceum TaxID=5849 RepID=A0A1J1GW94_PLAGA|nr:sugar transporter, putative [Plasmodium gallinaceum]CRG96742.1 sugar transporter, putative [Plasmodium gallinaceum]
MLYLTKVISNACLAVINCGLCLSSTNLARKMIVDDFKLCPVGYRGCDKEKWYFSMFYFILYMSSFFGCFTSLFFKNTDRRKFIIIIHYLFIIGSLLTIYNTPHIIIFLFSQAFFGLAIGCSVVIVCFYVLEYSPKIYQNFYGFYIQTFFSIGILISYIFGACYENIKFQNPRTTDLVIKILYKVHLCLPMIFSLISLILLHFVFKLDTPLHLYVTKNYEKFEKLKTKINVKEFDEKKEYHMNPATNDVTLLYKDLPLIDFLKNKNLRKASFTGSFLCYLYSFNGCFLFFTKIFLFYRLFSSTMLNTFISVGFILLYVISTIISTFLAEHVQKKKLLIIGLVVQGLASAGLVITYFLSLENFLNQIIVTLSYATYFIGLSLGFGHMIWTHVFEMFPKECKVVGALCSYYPLFIGAFIISFIFEFASKQDYAYLFIIFLVSIIVSIICFNSFYKEDKELIAKKSSNKK